MCLAGIIALLAEADGAGVVGHLYMLILTLLVIVVGQTFLILKRREEPAPLQLQLALVAPAPPAAPAAALGIRLPTKRARMTMAIHRLTVDDLRDLLRRHGRIATATKDLLIQRALTMNLEEVTGPTTR